MVGQVFVKASSRAKAYTRRQRTAILGSTPMNRAKRPLSALRALKSANRFISKGHGNQSFSRQLIEAARIDRTHIRNVVLKKHSKGRRRSVYS
jgi:hypothetical protein